MTTPAARAFLVFDRALDVPPAERAAWLEAACGSDRALRRQVDAMLAADAAPDALLDHDAGKLAARLTSEPIPVRREAMDGRAIGPYRILRELGRGGMGTVQLAVREDVGMQVALKIVRSSLAAPDAVRRFLAERRILARLSHANIAALLDAGVTPEETPWFAMELVEGVPITHYADQHQLNIDERLRLFEQVVDAVAHAHRHLVVHRDLKPTNILVDRDGRVKLLDFGIAKLLDEEGDAEDITRTGVRPMTPGYAAPEQVLGEPITTATDIYALGTILYELLTGRRAHPAQGRTMAELAREVVETDPPHPAATLTGTADAMGVMTDPAAVAEARRTTPSAMRRALSGDAGLIPMRAMAKEPARRYASADALLADLQALRAGKPVAARPDTWWYRSRKFMARHAVPLGAATVVAVGAIVGFSIYTARVARERTRAEQAAATAQAVSEFLSSILESADPTAAAGQQFTAVQLLEDGYRRVNTELEAQPEVRIELLRRIGDIFVELGRYDDAVDAMRTAIPLATALHGGGDVRTMRLRGRLGSYLAYRGDADQALEVFTAALADEDVTPGVITEVHAYLVSSLANVAHDLGDVALARRSFDQALSYPDSVIGGADDRLTMRNNYGHVLVTAGEYARAAAEWRQILAIREARGGALNTQTITARRNLSKALREQGELAEAERLGRAVVTDSRRVYPASHPRIAWALHELGATLVRQGQLAEGRDVMLEALAGYRAAPAQEPPRIARAQGVLAAALLGLGEVRAADTLLDAADRYFTEHGRANHPDRVELLMVRASLLAQTGARPAAESVLNAADALIVARLSPDHPRRVQVAALKEQLLAR